MEILIFEVMEQEQTSINQRIKRGGTEHQYRFQGQKLTTKGLRRSSLAFDEIRQTPPKNPLPSLASSSDNEGQPRPKKKHPRQLQIRSLKKCKTIMLVHQFISKLKQGAVMSQPCELNSHPHQNDFLERVLGDAEGIEANCLWNTFIQSLTLTTIIVLAVFYAMAVPFQQLQHSLAFLYCRQIALVVFLLQAVTNFLVKTTSDGKMINELTQIIPAYLKGSFRIDFLELVLLTLDLCLHDQVIIYLRLRIILKLGYFLEELDRLKNMVCVNVNRQNQWGVVVVLITNILFAHFMSCVLNAMPMFNPDKNWWQAHALNAQAWYIRYIYGYYWATNIMFTVGFGDFSATNHQQALIITFVEMVSCITLAYNINWVGNLLGSIRAQQVDKSRNLRTLTHMFNQTGCINKNLESRVKHYIVKAFQMKRKMDLEGQSEALSLLPDVLKQQVLTETHRHMFKCLPFFKSLTERTFNGILLKLHKKFTHPQQIIIKRGQTSKLYILQAGQVSMVVVQNKRGKLGHIPFQCVEAKQKNYRMLAFRDFICSRQQKHQVVSVGYSTLLSIQSQDFLTIIKQNMADYERYCALRDEDFPRDMCWASCDICKTIEHSNHSCPRLHYIPHKQIVFLKYRNLPTIRMSREIYIRKRHRFGSNNLNPLLHCLINIDKHQNELEYFRRNSEHQTKKSESFRKYTKLPLTENTYEILELDRVYLWRHYFPKYNFREVEGMVSPPTPL